MKHEIFCDTHYNAGLNFGQKLAAQKQSLLQQAPFPLTQERQAFAAACLPIYQQFFPEILQEIAGLSVGQNCSEADVQTLLFSMYALPPACQCSCLASAPKAGPILLGRNSDFLIELAELNLNVIYHFTDGGFSFQGNTTAFIEMEDGVNQHGLTVGLTSVAPAKIQPGFNAGLLLRWLLEKCRNTSEVLQSLQQLPIASAQTLTVADAQGEIALIECEAGQIAIKRPEQTQPYVFATNSFHLPEMAAKPRPTVDNWQAEERWQTLNRALQAGPGCPSRQTAEQILAGRQGFLCQYDRQTGHDTVWSTIYDLSQKAIWQAEGNPGRTTWRRDLRFSF